MLQIAVPLNALLKNGVLWARTDIHHNAFHKLKQRCAETPVLVIPPANATMVVRCDASPEVVGVALYQQDAEEYLQPVESVSNAFADPANKLLAHDTKALALLYALSTFRHFLLHLKSDGQTDNAALSQIFTSKDMSDLYARWYHKKAEFTCLSIKHRPGRKIYCADVLSRPRPAVDDNVTPFFSNFRQDLSQGSAVASQASTVVHAEQLLDASAAFKHFTIEDAVLQKYQQDWPALYKADVEIAACWAEEGKVQWGFIVHQCLLWKLGASGPRLCVRLGANEVPFLQASHDSKLVTHAWHTSRTCARAWQLLLERDPRRCDAICHLLSCMPTR